jgi:hypothetical protein
VDLISLLTTELSIDVQYTDKSTAGEVTKDHRDVEALINEDTGKVRAVYPCTPDYFWCTGPTCETLRLRSF